MTKLTNCRKIENGSMHSLCTLLDDDALQGHRLKKKEEKIFQILFNIKKKRKVRRVKINKWSLSSNKTDPQITLI